MNVSYRWIRELAPDVADTPEQLAERLAMLGAPVDEIVSLAAGLGDIRIARVTATRQHPNADRLRICEVDAGTGEMLQVVCGAPNVQPDRYYPFAPVGAALPGGMAIRQAKIRGELSQGMLCSERELELGRSHEGLMELHGEFTPGASFIEAAGLDDARIVVDVTANRPDLLSHIGIARELAPRGRTSLPAFPGAPAGDMPVAEADSAGEIAGVRLRIAEPAACSRYIAAVIRGVTVGPSPEWLAARLRAIGLRPINNVVDATNYVLFELGQPLHAFDLARLVGPEIVVRRAAPGERIVTLDGIDRALADDMLVIADAARPVAIAGVMGGRESEVGAETRDVLLECALFEPAGIRRTRSTIGLSTDASYRFERGVDPDAMQTAARRAAALIVAIAGGALDGGILDVAATRVAPRDLPLRLSRIAQVLGREFSEAEVRGALEPIGFAVETRDPLRVRIPGYRLYDVSREIDLVEEVARRFGYDNFADDPRPFRAGTVSDAPLSQLEDRLRAFMAARGFFEARSLAFAPAADGSVALLNPLSAEESALRGALLPGLLRRLEHNFAHGVRNVRLFEIGTVFAPGADHGRPLEETRIAAVLTGAGAPPHWSGDAPAYDIWDLKGLFAALCEQLGFAAEAVVPARSDAAPFLNAAAFEIDAPGLAGTGGQVNDATLDAPAWAGAIFGLEATLPARAAAAERPQVTPLPVHPAVDRDLALLLPRSAAAADVRATIAAEGGPLLQDVSIFDLYEGAGMPQDTRSVAYRLRFRAPDRTLTDKEVDKAVDRVLRRLKEESGVERRA